MQSDIHRSCTDRCRLSNEYGRQRYNKQLYLFKVITQHSHCVDRLLLIFSICHQREREKKMERKFISKDYAKVTLIMAAWTRFISNKVTHGQSRNLNTENFFSMTCTHQS